MTTHSPSSDASPATPRSAQQVAIVTGAGSGIGREMALLLGRQGLSVVLVGRRKETLEETASHCKHLSITAASHATVMVITGDLRQAYAPQRIVKETMERFGRIDALFNIAGSAPLMSLDHVTPARWRDCIDSNLSGPVLMTAAVWPVFQKQQSGFVGNISSMASVDPFPGFAMYAAAKTGLNMFTHCTAQEGSAINVKAVAVAPGAVETQMLRQNFGQDMIASDKTLAPAAVAQVLLDCMTGKRAFTSGQTIVLPSPS